jgi:short-subunit dehydrogenase
MKWQTENITLITGAAGGIGKAFAHYCASRKHRLVLLDRQEAELVPLAHWLHKNYGTPVHPFAIDITIATSLATVASFLQSHDYRIDWLINNAGVGHVSDFSKTAIHTIRDEINVNVLGTTLVTHTFLPYMNHSRKSYLLFMSSMASLYPLPLKNTYGAAKAYVNSLADSLRHELAEEKISVSVCCPGPVNSNMGQYLADKRLPWKDQLLVEDPETIVRIAINGMLNGKPFIVPGFFCRLLYGFTRLLPKSTIDRITKKQYRLKRKMLREKPLVPGVAHMA